MQILSWNYYLVIHNVSFVKTERFVLLFERKVNLFKYFRSLSMR